MPFEELDLDEGSRAMLASRAMPNGLPLAAMIKDDDRCIRWGDGTGEDLYASPGRDLLAGIHESAPGSGSAFWAVSYRQAFRLAAPPKGYPRRTC